MREINLYNIGETNSELRQAIINLRADYDAHNHDGSSSKAFETVIAETISSRIIAIRKSSYSSTTSGFWAGIVGNTMKLNVGDGTKYLKWTGSALEIAGDITGGSLNINNKAIIDSSGNATFVGITSLNIRSGTCFETIGRFITTGALGTGAVAFGNTGASISTGTTATSYARILWDVIAYAYSSSPTFSISLEALNLDITNGEGAAFVGIGSTLGDGSGYSFLSKSFAGFYFQKTGGVCSIYAYNGNGDASNYASSSALTTITTGDRLELLLKINGTTSIDYYWKKNAGTLSSATTLNTYIPTTSENYMHFSVSNRGTAYQFQLLLKSVSYER